ncbi:MAG: LssY C-terminal domain-containing protein [Acidobacteria bacterium]|nr:LssY C-terminal domain-containing protein [Acidobacteriota bacterium]
MIARLAAVVLVCAALRATDARPGYYHARLITPVASYSKAGTQLEARILGPVRSNRTDSIPRGAIIHGKVRSAQSIGLGFKRERASLELEFERCELPGGVDLPCEASLVQVDNARENTNKTGMIRGILAASHPYSWLNGIWYRPLPALFEKSPMGLIGAGGMLHAKMASNPIAAVGIVGSRLLLYRLPEPEIELPSGTDLVLRIEADTAGVTPDQQGENPDSFDQALLDELRAQPAETAMADRTAADDIVNMAFLGTKECLIRAFKAAGWTAAEPLNARTFSRTYKAVISMHTYVSAPVSALYYEDRLPELVFQKSFNTLAKRHHIRLWPVEIAGRTVWLGAATHDVAITFDWGRMNVTHRIDRHIDRERSKVLNDLMEPHGVSAWALVARQDRALHTSDKGPVVTDGSLAVVAIQPCDTVEVAQQPLKKPRRARPLLMARRVVLETRYYITRGNVYYWAYRGIRWGFTPKYRARMDDE